MVPRANALNALLAACFFAFQTSPASAELSLVSLKDVDPGAVCTDGSPAGYYWEAGTGGPSWYPNNIWIVYLQGGDWCHDQWSCHARCKQQTGWKWKLCSSNDWESTYPETVGALAAPQSSPLANANKVFVRYCTSDAFMGDTAAFGYEFRGARVVEAVFKDLVQRQGLGRGIQKDRLIFGGFSAGARGAMVHLDYVSSMLGSVAQGVDVVGFLDSPVWTEMPYFNGHRFRDFVDEAWDMHRWANISHLGSDCIAAYDKSSQWKCIFGEYRMPFVKSPYLLIASQYDAFQLSNYLGHKPKGVGTPAEKAYTKMFADRTVAFLEKLRSPIHAVFSWACWSHAVSQTVPGFTMRTCNNRTTILNALEQLLDLEPRTGDLEWIERCSGIACGTGCRAHHSYTHVALIDFLRRRSIQFRRRFGLYQASDVNGDEEEDADSRPLFAMCFEAATAVLALTMLAGTTWRAARGWNRSSVYTSLSWPSCAEAAALPLTDDTVEEVA